MESRAPEGSYLVFTFLRLPRAREEVVIVGQTGGFIRLRLSPAGRITGPAGKKAVEWNIFRERDLRIINDLATLLSIWIIAWWMFGTGESVFVRPRLGSELHSPESQKKIIWHFYKGDARFILHSMSISTINKYIIYCNHTILSTFKGALLLSQLIEIKMYLTAKFP